MFYRMRKIFLLLFIICLVLCLYGSLKDKDEKNVSYSDIQISDVDIAAIKPNEKRDFFVTINNKSTKEVYFEPPITFCGCMTSSSQGFTVPANQHKEIHFSYTAPNILGKQTQAILFKTSLSPEMSWLSNVSAMVQDDFFVSASQLTFLHSSHSDSKASKFIQIVSDNINEIEINASHPMICHEIVSSGEHQLHVKVWLHAEKIPLFDTADEICEKITISNNTENKWSVDIPVFIRPKPWCRVFPANINIYTNDKNSRVIKRVIGVKILDRHVTIPEVTMTSLVSWIKIQHIKKDVNYYWFDIDIYPQSIPFGFNDECVRLLLNKKQPLNLKCVHVER